METAAVVAITTIAIILSIFVAYNLARLKYERKYREWQQAEELSWQEEIAKACQTAVTQSRAVLGGKFTEQMAPYLPEFNYDPTEARFIGSPIDFIVFPGMSQGEPREIVIMEIKSGKSQLTSVERKIRQLVEDGMVRWELIQKPNKEVV